MKKWKDKNPQEKYESYQRLNKVEKLKKAKLEGFDDIEAFRVQLKLQDSNYMEGIETLCEKYKLTKSIKPVIHNVHILDSSGSMVGPKFDNANKGIQDEIEMLKQDDSTEYLQTFAYFKNSNPHIECKKVSIKDFIYPKEISTWNNTPLYRTIVKVLKELSINKDVKTLVKIFTDGEDYDASVYHQRYTNKDQCKKAIKKAQEDGVTITFVGTKEDVRLIIKELGIDKSNTLVHDNTAEGVTEAFNKTIEATRNYSKKVVKGEDVKTGFYKEIL